MKCPRCGFDNPEGSQACQRCGLPLQAGETPARETAPASTKRRPSVKQKNARTTRSAGLFGRQRAEQQQSQAAQQPQAQEPHRATDRPHAAQPAPQPTEQDRKQAEAIAAAAAAADKAVRSREVPSRSQQTPDAAPPQTLPSAEPREQAQLLVEKVAPPDFQEARMRVAPPPAEPAVQAPPTQPTAQEPDIQPTVQPADNLPIARDESGDDQPYAEPPIDSQLPDEQLDSFAPDVPETFVDDSDESARAIDEQTQVPPTRTPRRRDASRPTQRPHVPGAARQHTIAANEDSFEQSLYEQPGAPRVPNIPSNRSRRAQERVRRAEQKHPRKGVAPVNVRNAARAKPGEGMPYYPTAGTYRPVHLHQDKQPRRQRWYFRAFIVLLALILVGGIGYGAWRAYNFFQTDAQRTAASEAAHQKVTVDVALNVPDYLQGSSSPIPIRITGTDLDGKGVNQLELMTATKHTVDLLRGTYTFTPAGTPVTRSGATYNLPAAVTVVIDENGVTSNGTKGNPSFAYQTANPSAITDAQIQTIRTWMTDAGITENAIKSYLDAVTYARSSANADQKGSSSGTVTEDSSNLATSSFSFDVPEYWWDKVTYVDSTNDYGLSRTTLYQSGTRYALAWVEAVPANAAASTDSNEDNLVGSVKGSNYTINVWSRNWGYIAASQVETSNMRYDSTTLDQLIRLSTGGDLTYAEASQTDTADVGKPQVEYLSDELMPSVKAIG